MIFVAHETALDAPSQGTTLRALYEEKARRGDGEAVRALEPREYPGELSYLYHWSLVLHGRSGIGMGGFAPLSYTTIHDWSDLTGERPTADDVQALLRLDAVLLAPAPPETPQATQPAPAPRAWPTAKVPNA